MFKSILFNKNHWFLQLKIIKHLSFKSDSHYSVLGVGSLATPKEIKIAYYQKCKELHPDKNTNSKKQHSHIEFVKLNEAYSILSNASSRRDYDMSFNSSYNYPNPTNVYRNTSQGHPSRAKYTQGGYPNPYDDFARDSVYEEQMKFYREQMKYKHFYKPGQEYYDTSEKTGPVPYKTLLTMSLIVFSIFLFDAIFVTLTYNNDINNLQKNYSPLHNRKWRPNKFNEIKLNEYSDLEMEINEWKKYEADIEDKIREYKEYESTPRVRIYKRNPVKD